MTALKVAAVLNLITFVILILFDKSPSLQRQHVSQKSIKSTSSGPLLAVNQTVSSEITYSPKITDEISQAALDELDEEHQWKKHVKFMSIGAEKAGSSAFYYYFRQHSMLRENCKECGCFNMRWNESDKDCEQFLRIPEEDDSADFLVGDFSTRYLFRTETVIPKVAKAYPWIKIIAILRHPSDRAYSQYKMNSRWNKLAGERRTFEGYVLHDLQLLRSSGMLPHWEIPERTNKNNSTIPLEVWSKATLDNAVFEAFFGSYRMVQAWKRYHITSRSGPVAQGLYAVGLHRWFSFFPRERFLILNTNDLAAKDHRNEFMAQVYQFLDIPFENVTDLRDRNKGGYVDHMSDDVKFLLQRIYEPFTRKLEVMLGRSLTDLHEESCEKESNDFIPKHIQANAKSKNS